MFFEIIVGLRMVWTVFVLIVRDTSSANSTFYFWSYQISSIWLHDYMKFRSRGYFSVVYTMMCKLTWPTKTYWCCRQDREYWRTPWWARGSYYTKTSREREALTWDRWGAHGYRQRNVDKQTIEDTSASMNGAKSKCLNNDVCLMTNIEPLN
jgi:hypothetical protein